MDLCAITVAGYRRFSGKTKLQTNGKLVAILGPNEAGKSSLLRAILLISNDDAPADEDFARDQPRDAFLIEARYFLSDDDRIAAALPSRRWLYVRKDRYGPRTLVLDPPAAPRDLSPRREMKTAFEQILEGVPGDSIALDPAIEILSSEREDLDRAELDTVLDGAKQLEKVVDYNAGGSFSELIEKFSQVESAPNPTTEAISILRTRLPSVLMFDDAARDLRPSYGIADLKKAAPQALKNFCNLAQLDLTALISAHAASDDSQIAALEEGANDVLRERLKQDWQQSGLRLSIRSHDGRLIVHVVNAHRTFTSLAERSDGLRQFVALQAFTGGASSGDRILLIDEADARLHYDAQADLVQMLARQQLASKVIYTTHSAGCLPEDLGHGVRLVSPIVGNDAQSRIDNRFWGGGATGVAPLLIGLGATTMAFFPTRHAVLVEGAGDMLLLPTMFREALGSDVLGFQFVPGLSSSSSAGLVHAKAIGDSSGILYLVDSDEGGLKLKKQIEKDGANPENIFVLRDSHGNAEEVEDFLDSGLIIAAVNSLISKYYPQANTITLADLNEKRRMANLQAIYKDRTAAELAKVDLAYEVLDLLGEQPTRSSIDPNRFADLNKIASSILQRFEKLQRG